MQVGFAGLLTIVFIVLKLLDQIAWSWVWVLAPIWISVVLWFVLLFGTMTYIHVKTRPLKRTTK